MAAKNFEDQSFKSTTKNLVISGLALASALAWNDAITTTIKSILPNTKSDSLSLIIYAIIITVFSFYVIRFIDRITREKIPVSVPIPVAVPTSPQAQVPGGQPTTNAPSGKVSD